MALIPARGVAMAVQMASGKTIEAPEKPAGDGVELQGARNRLKKLREAKLQSGEQLFEPIEVDDEKLFIKRLNWSELTRCHLLAGRTATGELDINANDDDLKNMVASSLAVAVFCDELGQTPYFANLSEAAELAEATDLGNVGFISVLFNEVTSRNPGLQPTFVKGARLVMERLQTEETNNDGETSATPPAFTTSTTPTGDTGSNATSSIASPSASRENSEMNDSQSTGAAT